MIERLLKASSVLSEARRYFNCVLGAPQPWLTTFSVNLCSGQCCGFVVLPHRPSKEAGVHEEIRWANLCVLLSVLFILTSKLGCFFLMGDFFFFFFDKTEIALLLVSGTIVMRRGKTDIFVLWIIFPSIPIGEIIRWLSSGDFVIK